MNLPSEHYQALPIGTVLAEYELQQVLGCGGFGIAYLAYDALLDQHVVIKEYLPAQHATRISGKTVIPVHSKAEATFKWGLSRFLDEAKALAAFRQHPHIVSVLRYFEANNTAYMVMEFLGEVSLQDYLHQKCTLTPVELDVLIFPLLDALAYVHAAGVIHRDVKPSNILLHHRQPILIDFGAARQALSGKTQNLTEVISQGYSPPEQYCSTGVTQGAWTDIYALAGVLYRCVTGVEPIEATARLVHDALPRLAADEGLRAQYAPALLAAIDWGLQLKVEDRPQTIAVWRDSLLAEPLVNVVPPSQPAPTAVPSQPIEMSHHATMSRQLSMWVAASCVVLSGIGFVSYHYWQRPSVTPLPMVAASSPVITTQPMKPITPMQPVPDHTIIIPAAPDVAAITPKTEPVLPPASVVKPHETISDVVPAEAVSPSAKKAVKPSVVTKPDEKKTAHNVVKSKPTARKKRSIHRDTRPKVVPVIVPRPYPLHPIRRPARPMSRCDSRDELCRQLRG
ncbi:MAG: hypothetical protein RI964_632 [Pseudomonadota bacterium]|jgi:serine/threonine protein kinase